MRCAHHLREVNNDGFPCFSLNEDIEFVIIAMDQARLRESNNDVHQIRVQFARVWDIRYLATTLPKKKKKKKIKSGSAKEKKKKRPIRTGDTHPQTPSTRNVALDQSDEEPETRARTRSGRANNNN